MKNIVGLGGWVGFLVGAVCFHFTLGISLLSPTFDRWLLSDDPGTHVLGWYFFRNDAWSFPLTKIHSFMAPIGSTLIQTDSIPWWGVGFKIVSPWLPSPFQYFGLWLFLCYGLLGFFAYRILKKSGTDFFTALLGTTLVVLSPVFVNRFGHNALCAHWIILAFLELALDAVLAPASVPLPFWRLLILTGIAVGTHAYLAFMSGLLSLALFAGTFWESTRQGRKKIATQALAWAFFQIGLAWSLGYFVIAQPRAGMFTEFGIDLLSFINPGYRSRFLPQLFQINIENFAYLGIGLLSLFIVAAGIGLWNKEKKVIPWRKAFGRKATRPFLWVVIFFGIYCFSPKITWAGHRLVSLLFLYRLIAPIPDIFRACGRFLWPAYYLALLFAILVIARSLPKKATYAVLLTVLTLQWWDLGTWYLDIENRIAYPTKTAQAVLPPVPSNIARLTLIPPYLPDGDYLCGEGIDFSSARYLALGKYAAMKKLSYNSGYASRPPSQRLRQLCEQTMVEWEKGDYRKGELYVVRPDVALRTEAHFLKSLACQKWEQFWVCYSP